MKIFDRPTYYSLFIITLTTSVAAYIASLCALPIEPILALVLIIMAYPCFHGMSYQYAITPLEARMRTLITLLAYPIVILTQLSLLSLNHWGIDLPHLPSIIIAAHIVIFLTSGLFCRLYFNQRLETSKGLQYKLKIHEWCEAYPCLDRIAQTWTPQPFEHESVNEFVSHCIGSGTLAIQHHPSRRIIRMKHPIAALHGKVTATCAAGDAASTQGNEAHTFRVGASSSDDPATFCSLIYYPVIHGLLYYSKAFQSFLSSTLNDEFSPLTKEQFLVALREVQGCCGHDYATPKGAGTKRSVKIYIKNDRTGYEDNQTQVPIEYDASLKFYQQIMQALPSDVASWDTDLEQLYASMSQTRLHIRASDRETLLRFFQETKLSSDELGVHYRTLTFNKFLTRLVTARYGMAYLDGRFLSPRLVEHEAQFMAILNKELYASLLDQLKEQEDHSDFKEQEDHSDFYATLTVESLQARLNSTPEELKALNPPLHPIENRFLTQPIRQYIANRMILKAMHHNPLCAEYLTRREFAVSPLVGISIESPLCHAGFRPQSRNPYPASKLNPQSTPTSVSYPAGVEFRNHESLGQSPDAFYALKSTIQSIQNPDHAMEGLSEAVLEGCYPSGGSEIAHTLIEQAYSDPKDQSRIKDLYDRNCTIDAGRWKARTQAQLALHIETSCLRSAQDIIQFKGLGLGAFGCTPKSGGFPEDLGTQLFMLALQDAIQETHSVWQGKVNAFEIINLPPDLQHAKHCQATKKSYKSYVTDIIDTNDSEVKIFRTCNLYPCADPSQKKLALVDQALQKYPIASDEAERSSSSPPSTKQGWLSTLALQCTKLLGGAKPPTFEELKEPLYQNMRQLQHHYQSHIQKYDCKHISFEDGSVLDIGIGRERKKPYFADHDRSIELDTKTGDITIYDKSKKQSVTDPREQITCLQSFLNLSKAVISHSITDQDQSSQQATFRADSTQNASDTHQLQQDSPSTAPDQSKGSAESQRPAFSTELGLRDANPTPTATTPSEAGAQDESHCQQLGGDSPR
ncbi:MAG: hypothetical protein CMF51_01880 [Legionellales bacterium]|nr:hypothetical protein [Legionellales bacterium]